MTEQSAPRVFLSHSHVDTSIARRVRRWMIAHGVKVWTDERKMKIGMFLPTSIRDIKAAADSKAPIGPSASATGARCFPWRAISRMVRSRVLSAERRMERRTGFEPATFRVANEVTAIFHGPWLDWRGTRDPLPALLRRSFYPPKNRHPHPRPP